MARGGRRGLNTAYLPMPMSKEPIDASRPDELDPLPSVLAPEGVVVTRLAAIAGSLHRIDVTGVRGAADAAVVAALVQAGEPHVVVVAPDNDGARRLAADVAFLMGTPASVLVLSPPESSP